jgi:hypothetical protein
VALRRKLVGLLCACAGIGVMLPAPTAGAAGWVDGGLEYTYTINCASVIFGNPYFEALSGHYASFFDTTNQQTGQPQQGVGEIFYIRTIIGGLGAPCAGPYAVPEFKLHSQMSLAISNQYPVFCFGQRPNQNTWGQFTGADCPQNPSQGRFGGNSFRFIPQGGAYPLPQGSFIQVQIPVYVRQQFKGMGGPNDSENCGGCFYAPSQILDGSSDPTGFAKQWVFTDKTFPAVAFPDNPTSTGTNTASVRAFLYNYFAPGTATIGICENANYNQQTGACNGFYRESSPAQISNQSYAVQLDATFNNVKPNTTYWAIVFFDFTQPEDGSPQSGNSHQESFVSGPQGVANPGAPPSAGTPGQSQPPANAEQPPTQPPPPDDQSSSISPEALRSGAPPNKPAPGPTPNVPGRLATTATKSNLRLGALLRSGVRVVASCSRACRLRFDLLIPRSLARRMGLSQSRLVLVGRASKRFTRAGKATVRVKLTRKAKRRLRRARRFTLTLRTTATEPNAKAIVTRKPISVRR